jgi:hypothetical protein
VISGNEKVIFKGPGGTIIIDGGNITLKGKVTIKGSLDVSGGSPEKVDKLKLVANAGDLICVECLKNKLAPKLSVAVEEVIESIKESAQKGELFCAECMKKGEE